MSSDLSSDVIDGKRKRSDLEFDSDTESSGNTFQGQNILSTMEFNHANSIRVMKELAKARLKRPPYDTTDGWRDPQMWSILMLALVGSNSPNMCKSVWKIIFTFESLFLRECCFQITDPKLLKHVHTVFGPSRCGDPGSLRTCNLNPTFLAFRQLASNAVPSSIFDVVDADADAGECVVQHGGVPSNSPPNPSRKKTKMTVSVPTLYERLSNPNNPAVPPCHFNEPEFCVIDGSGMAEVYFESTKHLSEKDQGIFLSLAPPESLVFQSLALEDPAKRKAAIESVIEKHKVKKSKPSRPPQYKYHHPQE